MTYMRVPVLRALRISPFENMEKHAEKVRMSAEYLRKAIEKYINQDYEAFGRCSSKINSLEKEADIIKSNIRNHMPKELLLSYDKNTFLFLLKEQDNIIDLIQDTAVWISLREKPIPYELSDDFFRMSDSVVDIVKTAENAVRYLKRVVETSYSRDEREKIKEVIHNLHVMESEIDTMGRELTKKTFKMESALTAVQLTHMLKLIELLSEIGDHAENVGDMIRALIAR